MESSRMTAGGGAEQVFSFWLLAIGLEAAN
jgi:hypothetical protein